MFYGPVHSCATVRVFAGTNLPGRADRWVLHQKVKW
jgi:hypothetical protein